MSLVFPETEKEFNRTPYPLPKILIIGHGGHGKGTAAKLLCALYGHTSRSSSEVAFPIIYPLLVAARDYQTKEEAVEHKTLERLLWKQAITLLNTPDKTTLARLILTNATIYDGMRCKEEYQASKHLFDHVIWVDGSERKGKDPSMTIEYDFDTMWYLDNNREEKELYQNVVDLYLNHIQN